MLLVPRHVRKVQEQADEPSQALEEFRNQAAWVLLGEPGAGKSKTFEEEAKITGGYCVSIAEFLHDDLHDDWQDKTLFLDGLDETRASGSGDSILLKIRARLIKLGKPSFRIACRAADWFGSTDSETLNGAAPDGQLVALVLEPLSDEDILAILRQDHAVIDPESFVEKARKHGVDNLLSNPQTLNLLVKATRGEQWPDTRQKTFELACKTLAEEASKAHRNQLRSHPLPLEKLLDAAGQLCAALLLSDKAGIALDQGSADERFPSLEDFSPPDLRMARGAVRRTLFRPSPSSAERVVPSHRSITEFLAARWMANRVDHDGLPLGRVLNLLLGADGRTVSGLRGLYGWLALHCRTARPLLIDSDALTVVVYGDVKPMQKADKKHILTALRDEAGRHTAFRRNTQTIHPFGALADPELTDDFIAALESPERDDATQSFTDCVLDILAEGEALPGFEAAIRNVIADDSRWGKVRTSALQAWLKHGVSVKAALVLLDAIKDGQIVDCDDELAGLLLNHLYPNSIAPTTLMRYLHAPKNQSLIGSYSWFWSYNLPKNAPTDDLPVLLDQLATRTDLPSAEDGGYHINRMLGALLARGIALHGEEIDDERLFGWLNIGADKYGHSRRQKEDQHAIANWLEGHPRRFKGVLALCYKQCGGDEDARARLYVFKRRLHGADAPQDIGLWHLEQASQAANDALAEDHLAEAVNALIQQRGSTGLTLEGIEAWGEANPERKHWLAHLLAWEIPEWRIEDAARAGARRQERADLRRQCSRELSTYRNAIATGTANVALMHELAGVWLDNFSDTQGETPLERFDSYCETGAEALSAAESGFRLCPTRSDLPAVADIIDLSTKKRQHLIRQPCLIGMDLRWRDGANAVDALSNDTLRRMLAFRLSYGADDTPKWFTHLVEVRPALVAEVLIDYASIALKSKMDFVSGIYPLAHDPAYAAVAAIAAPSLLAGFPLRSKSSQLSHLEYLLKAALIHSREALAVLVEKKTATKSMDVAQKVYWLTAAMLLDPEKYEAALWGYIGSSSTRANYLSGFLSERFSGLGKDYQLSARTIGKLIELLTPHAEFDWSRGGWVSKAMQHGDHVRAMVTRLGALGTREAAQEIERLLALPALKKLKFQLEDSRHQLRLQQRENTFRFPSLADAVRILNNRDPTSAADLAALTLDHLDGIARKIRSSNSDLFSQFWTETATNTHKPENSCRDVLLEMLKACLASFGIDCQPEGDHFNDKRADIRLSWRNEFELPIEIKGEWNDSLWTALRSQLIAQYAIAPKAAGRGIYLVLWFGGEFQKAARDGGKKPRSAEELQGRLDAQLDPTERKRIFVRVLDVSWPKDPEAPSHTHQSA